MKNSFFLGGGGGGGGGAKKDTVWNFRNLISKN